MIDSEAGSSGVRAALSYTSENPADERMAAGFPTRFDSGTLMLDPISEAPLSFFNWDFDNNSSKVTCFPLNTTLYAVCLNMPLSNSNSTGALPISR